MARPRHVVASTVMSGCLGAAIACAPSSPGPSASSETTPTASTSASFPRPAPPSSAGQRRPATPAQVSSAEFGRWARTLSGSVSVAVAAVGSSTTPVELAADDTTDVAWSTIKVPLTLAAARQGSGQDGDIQAALTASDNAAAESLWSSLGPPATAARAVQGVLRDGGDSRTVVQQRRVRSGFTAFGQTRWSVADQARWLASLPCASDAEVVITPMRSVISGQRWGFGTVDGAAIKGGWGPDTDGAYTVRQIAIVGPPTAATAFAVSVRPNGGTFADGTALLSRVAQWLWARIHRSPRGSCRP